MISARRIENRENAATSGIAEDITETDPLLDDVMKEKWSER